MIIIFSQLTSFSIQTQKKKGALFVLFFFLLSYSTYDIQILSYKSFYSQQNYQLNDFFYFFNFFFEKQTLLTLFVIILITIYSLFFIVLYFITKQFKLSENNKNSKILCAH